MIEIMLDRAHDDIGLLKKAYTRSHGRELSKHINAQRDNFLSPDLKRSKFARFPLLSLAHMNAVPTMALKNQRDADLTVDKYAVIVDVEALVTGRKGQKDVERLQVIEIFVNRSKPHLAAVTTSFG